MDMKLKWKPEYCIGIERIDRQHEEIFNRLLALENSVAKQDAWHIQKFFIAEVANYLKFHFSVEEALLEILGHPGLAEHSAGHVQLAASVGELERTIKESPSTAHLVDFFENWFVRHVLDDDQVFSAYAKRMR